MFSAHMLIRPRRKIIDDYAVDCLYRVVEKCGLNVRSSDQHRFYPYGITTTLILAESHVVLSTWPVDGFLQIDFFCCSKDSRADMEMFFIAAKEVFDGATKCIILDRNKMVVETVV
jgi:S-adenosylmethionine/arginine decarboxylase-like enzyme